MVLDEVAQDMIGHYVSVQPLFSERESWEGVLIAWDSTHLVVEDRNAVRSIIPWSAVEDVRDHPLVVIEGEALQAFRARDLAPR